ncbi:hypothetical protein [Mangrovimonas aestuarii]|uniref:hypothetical protein n=1 Tax=Mangrovimonas aestuarii TaxID=3018443 RepID=UPI002379C11C|nr:hypothetical protein [Mangrovimonas aestuarii]
MKRFLMFAVLALVMVQAVGLTMITALLVMVPMGAIALFQYYKQLMPQRVRVKNRRF